MANELTITILDLPEIQEILHEALDMVPEWEREDLLERLEAVIEQAKARRRA